MAETVAAAGSANGSQPTLVQEKAAGPHKVPIEAPLPECTAPARPDLTKEQQAKYDHLLEQVKAFTDVAVPSKKELDGPITDAERMWLTRECLLRYLRATKWNEKEAEKRLRGTLAWRREFGVDGLTYDHISPEQETGKQFLFGYDKEGRACLYLNPGRQNTEPSHRQVEHLVFMLERVLDIMPAQREKLALLINFKASKNRKYTAPGIGIAREVLHILQTHYPERLGRALIMNVPWVVWGFFKLITPFIDPMTRDKLKFNEDMTQYVPKEHLWTEAGGAMEVEYEHEVYWPALKKLCDERRAAKERRWIAGDKQVGELEDYLNGFLPNGVAPQATPAAPVAGGADAVFAAAIAGAGNQQEAAESKEQFALRPPSNDAPTDKPEDLKMGDLKV